MRRPPVAPGTVVDARVEARVLGLRLLTVDATIALAPADLKPAPPPRVRTGRGLTPGRGLAEASRFIHEGETALAAARSDGAARGR